MRTPLTLHLKTGRGGLNRLSCGQGSWEGPRNLLLHWPRNPHGDPTRTFLGKLVSRDVVVLNVHAIVNGTCWCETLPNALSEFEAGRGLEICFYIHGSPMLHEQIFDNDFHYQMLESLHMYSKVNTLCSNFRRNNRLTVLGIVFSGGASWSYFRCRAKREQLRRL